jgi:histidinol-phosphate/aromatic aminotransferase/cobyric acid decarboxylase-like protein
MAPELSERFQREFLERGFSRRQFGRIAALLGAGATLPFYGEAALAQLSQIKDMPSDAVKINANENPLGPAPEAIEAMTAILKQGGRYDYGLTDEFRDTLAADAGLAPQYVQPFAGSSAPLTQAVLAFTSPERSFVTCEPGYEAGERAAKFIGAKVIRIPLTKTYAHDVKAMAAVDSNAGILYVCNPNNPSGTLTPDADLDWLADNLPRGAVLLLDEAYIQIAGATPRSDLVAQGKDVIILRTFSKIYGMAGLRAGAALARPELLERITPYSSGALPTTAMVAATASLKVPDLVPKRRKLIGDVRADVLAFLDQHGFDYIPSTSNKFMVDVKQPGEVIIQALP